MSAHLNGLIQDHASGNLTNSSLLTLVASRSGQGPAPKTTSTTKTAPLQQPRDNALTDFQTRRINRHLDDLEVGRPPVDTIVIPRILILQRTNPTDIPSTSFIPVSSSTPLAFGGIPGQGTMLPDILTQGTTKKKQTPNVRKVLYGKKSLRDWLEELVSVGFRVGCDGCDGYRVGKVVSMVFMDSMS